MEENQSKNRYSDFLPCKNIVYWLKKISKHLGYLFSRTLDDHSRVKLMTKEEGDYINANFVPVSLERILIFG